MPAIRGRTRVAGVVVFLVIVGTACSSREREPLDRSDSLQINAQVASYDVAVGPPARFLVGLLTKDNRFVSFGSVRLRFSYLGAVGDEGQGPPKPGPRRQTASPGAAAAMRRMVFDLDLRLVLPAIRVPTMVIHHRGNWFARAGHGRYLAEHIAGARYVELPGSTR